jgi:fructose-bisphosphate aldolase/6-deoxy-5-ketofructose 1-phosphate synthase
MMVPCSVPKAMAERYKQHMSKATHNTERLFLFAGDQKIEHLNADFKQVENPEHLFVIASKARIGVFATQLGLVARYGAKYPAIPYLIKMNAKTNFAGLEIDDPMSYDLTTVADIVRFQQQTNLSILGVGMTIYLGSKHEGQMLASAARLVLEAHQHGLLVVLWVYPRGKAVKQERSEDTIAGATGVAHALGADFVKVNPPQTDQGVQAAELLQQAVNAAGNTGVLCSGGSLVAEKDFLKTLHAQLHVGAAGVAVGRNIYQKSLPQAVAFCDAIASLIYDNTDLVRAEEKVL